MFIDNRLYIAKAQVVTATAASTDSIDFGAIGRQVGVGEPLWWVVLCKSALAGTSPQFWVDQQTSDASNFGSLTAPQRSEIFTAFALNQVLIQPASIYLKRYARLAFGVGGTSPTITVDAFLTSQEPPTWAAMADAI